MIIMILSYVLLLSLIIVNYKNRTISRLTVVSREAKEEVPRDERTEYFTRTNLVKLKNRFTNEP